MRRATALLISLGVSVAACGRDPGPRAGGTQTHWLAACASNADCGAALACACGVCVAPCDAPGDACAAPVASATCFATDAPSVIELCAGEPASAPACLATCADDGDCTVGRCSGGACIPDGSGSTTGGSGGAAASGGTATGGSGGAAASSVQCGSVICAAGEICCGPPDCGNCVNALSGANCPDTCPSAGGAGGTCSASGALYAPPDLDRTCATSTDCFLGVHLADCCGSWSVLSFNGAARARFVEYEATCAISCACASQPPIAQDGSPLTELTAAVAECIDGRCLARGPEHTGECLDPETCIDFDTGGACISAPGPQGAGICRGIDGLCFDCDCAAPDTPIATPTGERPIAELRPGDLVYSVDDAALVVVPIQRVNRTAVAANHGVVEVTLETGRVLHISARHPTADGRTFGELATGDALDGQRIVSARWIPYGLPFTYDILPRSSTGTYVAGGALVGSTLF